MQLHALENPRNGKYLPCTILLKFADLDGVVYMIACTHAKSLYQPLTCITERNK